jgi:uncharacterized coiled-coil protein SlyX
MNTMTIKSQIDFRHRLHDLELKSAHDVALDMNRLVNPDPAASGNQQRVNVMNTASSFMALDPAQQSIVQESVVQNHVPEAEAFNVGELRAAVAAQARQLETIERLVRAISTRLEINTHVDGTRTYVPPPRPGRPQSGIVPKAAVGPQSIFAPLPATVVPSPSGNVAELQALAEAQRQQIEALQQQLAAFQGQAPPSQQP